MRQDNTKSHTSETTHRRSQQVHCVSNQAIFYWRTISIQDPLDVDFFFALEVLLFSSVDINQKPLIANSSRRNLGLNWSLSMWWYRSTKKISVKSSKNSFENLLEVLSGRSDETWSFNGNGDIGQGSGQWIDKTDGCINWLTNFTAFFVELKITSFSIMSFPLWRHNVE